MQRGVWHLGRDLLGGLMAVLGAMAPMAMRGQGSPAIIWQQTLDSDRINTLRFTADGSQLITGSSDRLIYFWNAANGTPLRNWDNSAPDVHDSSVECLALNPAGTVLATVNYQQLKLWSGPGGNVRVINADTDWDVWCDFSADGTMVATASFDTYIKVWRVSDGALLDTFTSDALQRAVAFSPNGQWMASADGEGVITVRRVSDWAVIATLTAHTADVYVLKFSPDSTMIGSGGYDKTCRIWSTATWSLRYTFSNPNGNVYALAFSPDSQTLAYSEGENNRIRLAHTSNGSIYGTYDQNVDNVQCMAFSPQGALAYGRVDATVVVAKVGGTTGNPPPPPSPFISLAGYYYGALASSPLSAVGSGRVGLTVGPNGGFQGSFRFGMAIQYINGYLASDGSYSGTISRSGQSPLRVSLQLDMSGSSQAMTGSVTDGSMTANLEADLLVWDATKNPAPFSGNYTAWIQPDTSQPNSPQGYGYMAVWIDPSGTVTYFGQLADGQYFSSASLLNRDLTWPFYFSTPLGHEVALGSLSVSDGQMSGGITWFRDPLDTANFPGGFSAQASFSGSPFLAAQPGKQTLRFGSAPRNVSLAVGGADISSPMYFDGVILSNGWFSGTTPASQPRQFSLYLGPYGGIKGSFINSTTGQWTSYIGVVLQNQNAAAGAFISSGRAGYVQVSPAQ